TLPRAATEEAAMASRRCAFSLVELLVVIGIIVILIAIMLPIVIRARGTAINQVCKNNLRQIGAGILMYVNNNKGRFPDPMTLGGADCRRLVGEIGGGPPEVFGWSALLDQTGYLPADRATGGVWVCPAQRQYCLDYKNTYLAWTSPHPLGWTAPYENGRRTSAPIIVWENYGVQAYP